MPKYSKISTARLSTTHDDLQRLFNEVIKHIDCTIICGHRNKLDQEKACAQGFSKVHWPNGKHNSSPSLAVDVVPYPIDWDNTDRIDEFAKFVLDTATYMNIKIRWGHDWNMDGIPDKSGFVDRPHYELVR